jgi:UDP-glucose 4-epimerase
MRDVGVRRVVLVSSGAVYGEQPNQPLIEDAPPNPRSPYAASKLAAEYYVRTIGALWGIETVILRVFNAYGPGQHLPPVHAPVIPNFLRQASLGGTMVIHGDGSQTRDYVYIDDVVNAMVSAVDEPAANGKILNIGSGVETPTRDLARLVVDICGNSPEIIYNPRNEGGVKRMCAGIDLARRILRFEPTISLGEGMRRTFDQDVKLIAKAG